MGTYSEVALAVTFERSAPASLLAAFTPWLTASADWIGPVLDDDMGLDEETADRLADLTEELDADVLLSLESAHLAYLWRGYLRGWEEGAPVGFAGLPVTAFDGHRLTTRFHQKASAEEMAELVASLGQYLGEADDPPGRRLVGVINEEHMRVLLVWQTGRRVEFEAMSDRQSNAPEDS